MYYVAKCLSDFLEKLLDMSAGMIARQLQSDATNSGLIENGDYTEIYIDPYHSGSRCITVREQGNRERKLHGSTVIRPPYSLEGNTVQAEDTGISECFDDITDSSHVISTLWQNQT